MNAIYEYILAGLMMFIMLAVMHTYMQNLIYDATASITQEDYNLAESLIDLILLSPGDPPNWGIIDPEIFGLATQETTEAYALDPLKVIRLDENCTEYQYITPGELRSLLGLTGDVNLVIRITPMFIVDAQPLGGAKYRVTITDHRGRPVPNVNITGFYVPESLGSSDEERFQAENITGFDGSCILDFSVDSWPLSNYVLVIQADLLGVKTMWTDPPYLRVRVEGGEVVQSEVPLINTINYTSGSFYGLNTDYASRYVKIDGFTYYFELEIWR